jgi:hypothetical protein
MSVFRVWSRVNGVYNGCAPVGFHFGSVGTLLRAAAVALPGFPVVLLVLRWPGRARYGVLCVGKKRVCPGVFFTGDVTIDTSVQNHNHSETSSAYSAFFASRSRARSRSAFFSLNVAAASRASSPSG